jgi:addiction module RelE/StbE family toxin
MNIVYKDEAIKALKKLGPANQTKAKKKITALLTNPLLGKPLQGTLAGIRSIKVWPIRILYTFNNDTQTITVRTIGQRGDVYKG